MRKLIIALTAFMLLGLVSKAQDKPIIDIGGEWNLEQGTDAKGVTYDKVLITQNGNFVNFKVVFAKTSSGLPISHYDFSGLIKTDVVTKKPVIFTSMYLYIISQESGRIYNDKHFFYVKIAIDSETVNSETGEASEAGDLIIQQITFQTQERLPSGAGNLLLGVMNREVKK